MPLGTPYAVGSGSTNANQATCPIPVSQATNAGDAIAVGASSNGTTTPSSCADTQGNSYTLVKSNTGQFKSAVFVAAGATAALSTSDTITVTYSAASTDSKNAGALGCSGVKSSGYLDANVINSSSGSTTPAAVTGQLSQFNELIVAWEDNASTGGNIAWDSPLTAIVNPGPTGTNQYSSLAAAVVFNEASVTASGTIVSAKWDIILISLRGADSITTLVEPPPRAYRRVQPQARRRPKATGTGLPLVRQPPKPPEPVHRPQRSPAMFWQYREAHGRTNPPTAFPGAVQPVELPRALRRPQKLQRPKRGSSRTPPTGGVTIPPSAFINRSVKPKPVRPSVTRRRTIHQPTVLSAWTTIPIYQPGANTGYTVVTVAQSPGVAIGDSFQVYDFAQSWQLVWHSTGGTSPRIHFGTTTEYPAQPNTQYTAAAWLAVSGGAPWSSGIQLGLQFHDINGTQIGTTISAAAVSSSTPTLSTLTATSPAGTAYRRMVCTAVGAPPTNVIFNFSLAAQGPGAIIPKQNESIVRTNGATLNQQQMLRPLSNPPQDLPSGMLVPVDDTIYTIINLTTGSGFNNLFVSPTFTAPHPGFANNTPANGYILVKTPPGTQPARATKKPLGPARLFIRSRMPRFYAQDIPTGQWIHRDIPNISNPTITFGLNGSGTCSFSISPVHRSLGGPINPLLEMWKTAIYVEENDEIKWGGIITDQQWTGGQWDVSLNEFSSYANGFIYEGQPYKKFDIDALDVVRYIWNYIQSLPSANLGLDIDLAVCNVNLGAQLDITRTSTIDPKTHKKTIKVTKTKIPYKLDWWNNTDLGQEIGQIAQEVPFEWRETHVWTNASKTDVAHTVKFGVPRVGTRRQDLRFIEGENVITSPVVSQAGENYANDIIFLGRGHGAYTIRAKSADADQHLRRPLVYTNQTVHRTARAAIRAHRILKHLNHTDTITQATVKNHPNAPFHTFGVGDDVLITVTSGWRAGLQIWSRIIQIEQNPQTNQLVLTTVRSDSFTYMAQSGMAGTE